MRLLYLSLIVFGLTACSKELTCECTAKLTERKINDISIPDSSYTSSYKVIKIKSNNSGCNDGEKNQTTYYGSIKYTGHVKSQCQLK